MAIVLASALLAGCGGGSDSSSSTNASSPKPKSSPATSLKIESTPFGKQVTLICFNATQVLGSLPAFPFPGFDSLHPDTAKLPAIGRYFEQGSIPALERLVAKLKTVKPPAAEKQDFDEFVAQVEALLANEKRQADAAKSSDAKAFSAAVKDFDNRPLANAESALGVRSCFGIS